VRRPAPPAGSGGESKTYYQLPVAQGGAQSAASQGARLLWVERIRLPPVTIFSLFRSLRLWVFFILRLKYQRIALIPQPKGAK
jgi:hypothetical protein